MTINFEKSPNTTNLFVKGGVNERRRQQTQHTTKTKQKIRDK